MKTITIHIPEQEFLKFGFESESLGFEEFVEKIKIGLAKEALHKAQEIAEQVGLSELSQEEIDAEINAVRRAEDHS